MVLSLLFLSEAMDVNDSGVHVSHMDYLVQKIKRLLVVPVASLHWTICNYNLLNLCLFMLDICDLGVHVSHMRYVKGGRGKRS